MPFDPTSDVPRRFSGVSMFLLRGPSSLDDVRPLNSSIPGMITSLPVIFQA